jgi:hypothetical protein
MRLSGVHLLHQIPDVLWKAANSHVVSRLASFADLVLGPYIRTSTSKDYRPALAPSNFAGVRLWTREILQFRASQNEKEAVHLLCTASSNSFIAV